MNLKHCKENEKLKRLIAESSNGRTEAFEAFNWGSIPYSAAIEQQNP